MLLLLLLLFVILHHGLFRGAVDFPPGRTDLVLLLPPFLAVLHLVHQFLLLPWRTIFRLFIGHSGGRFSLLELEGFLIWGEVLLVAVRLLVKG
jgi:hypothetical protein